MKKKLTDTLPEALSHTGTWVRRQLWVWPLLAALLLGLVGWRVRHVVETAMRERIAGGLQIVLEADVTALRIWLESQQTFASAAAADDRVVGAVTRLRDLQFREPGRLPLSEETVQLRDYLAPMLKAHGYAGFVVTSVDGVVLAADHPDAVGQKTLAGHEAYLKAVWGGRATVSRPFPSALVIDQGNGQSSARSPTMFAAAPIRDGRGGVTAALALRLHPEGDFTRILTVARPGDSGETYAFDSRAVLLSDSRFEDELREMRLIGEHSDAILNLQIRDPQVNLKRGPRPPETGEPLPLTRMAAAAIGQQAGVDVDGYNDYRGVPVVGAWVWLDDYELGVATELDVEEAYRPLNALRAVFWSLLGLLGLAAAGIFGFSLVVSRLRRRVRRAERQATQLGQYSLGEQIGAGGMGNVYLAHHALLQRPTAVKLLNPERVNQEGIARFEREVQMTSQLTHPNTVEVYDFGRTPDGIFYYAMEYLDGVTLDQLVEQHGTLPEGRVIYVLRQVCGSLAEAHELGLVHRDVKPSNIMLCRRGGMDDVVKVLDFGLVKFADTAARTQLTMADALVGTPLYISPEGIESPDRIDARSDLYALGAVGYYLLTGVAPFRGHSVMDVCSQHLTATPVAPAERVGHPVADDLSDVILSCLAKRPETRPQTARELSRRLAACAAASSWNDETAAAWWREHRAARGPLAGQAKADTAIGHATDEAVERRGPVS